MPVTPTPRPPRTQVTVQVARGGGPGRAESAGDAVSARGRHRTPDTGRVPDPEQVGRVAASRAGTVPAQPGAPSRHTAPAQRSAPAQRTGPPERSTPAQRSAPARRSAPAERSAPAQRSAPAVLGGGSRAAAPSRPRASPIRPAARHDDAVTDLVAGPSRRGDDDEPDAPATGPVPGLLGLALGVLALLGAVIAAASPTVVLPVVGPLGTSPLALAALLGTGLLATACAGLGAGRHRTARPAAVTGMVVALAAVTATIVPLLALSL